MKGLDLRKFKKLHSNEHTTTLVHPDGHKISIAHNKIKEQLRDQLHKLPKFAEGGFIENAVKTVKSAFEEEPKKPGNKINPPDPEKAKAFQRGFNGEKPETKKYAEGGSVMDQYPEYSQQQTEPRTDVSSILTPESSVATPVQQQLQAMPNEPIQDENAPQNYDISKLGASATAGTAQAPTMAPHSNLGPIEQAAQEQVQGINMQAQAEANLGKQESGIIQQHVRQQQNLMQEAQARDAAITKEISNVTNDLKAGHIDPDHFWNSQSTLGKVSSAIGLILGGIGGGLTGQENPALKFLNAQIDRDIESQKAQMNTKHNLLSALNQQLGNSRDATKMAKMMYADIYANKIMDAAAKSKDPMAMSRAQQAIAQIHMSVAPMREEMAMKQAVFSGVQQGGVQPEQAVQWLVPKEHQKEALKEIGTAKTIAQNEAEIMKQFDVASKENTVLRRTAHGFSEPASMRTMNAMLLPIIHDAEGRVNEFEQKTVQDLMPSPGDTDDKIAEKRLGMQAFIEQKKQSPTLKAYGIPGFQTPSSVNTRQNKNSTYGK